VGFDNDDRTDGDDHGAESQTRLRWSIIPSSSTSSSSLSDEDDDEDDDDDSDMITGLDRLFLEKLSRDFFLFDT
jgi:hypothetical protein